MPAAVEVRLDAIELRRRAVQRLVRGLDALVELLLAEPTRREVLPNLLRGALAFLIGNPEFRGLGHAMNLAPSAASAPAAHQSDSRPS